MDNQIKELAIKLYEIRTMNWIECEYNGSGCIGMQLEKLLGKRLDKKVLPDYKNIEIKTKCLSKNMDFFGISLFSSSFDEKPFQMKAFFNLVSYRKNEKRYFQKRINTKKGLVINDIYLKIKPDDNKQILKLYVINSTSKKIVRSFGWTYSELKNRLYSKLKYMVLVYAKLYTLNNKRYVKYLNYNFYKIKNFDCFLNCIKSGDIYINFNVYEILDGNQISLFDKGTSFEIVTSKLHNLFEII